MQSEQHFKAVAKVLKDGHTDPSKGLHSVTLALADLFEKETPNFIRERFLADCGVKV